MGIRGLIDLIEDSFKAQRPNATEEDFVALRKAVKDALRDRFLEEIGRRVKVESINAILFAPDDEDSG